SGIVAIAAGSGQNLALKSDGTVWAWSSTATSTQVAGLSNITSIAMGSGHNLALKSDGTVWSWGTNTNGQLGNGTTVDTTAPKVIADLSGVISI
ncbi:hypothetical protein KIH86_00365, partial [Paenibacillus sp. HN-1]|nr:hypothetical protein [Paenibacillus sinensis]